MQKDLTRMILSTDPRRYDRKAVELKPKFVGYYSCGEECEISEDISRLRYVKKTLGEVNWDIKQSRHVKETNSSNVEQSSFFQYLRNHRKHLEFSSDVMRSTIVSARSVILDIAEMPYNNHVESAFCVHLLNGVIYLYKPVKNVDAEIASPHGRWAKKFQKYLTTGRANGVPDPEERVDVREEFVGVYELQLENHKIIYRSSIDGILLNEIESAVDVYSRLSRDEIIADINRRGIVRMKTSLRKDYNHSFRRHKSCHLWTAGTLGMAFETIIGFRNEDGIVYENQLYVLEEFERIGSGFWKKDVMANFISEFMTYIKTCLVNALQRDDIKTGEKILYFMKESRSPLVMCDKSDCYSYEWIPEWYLETVRRNIQNE